MHPIERLRAVARASSISPALAVRETAAAISAVASDPYALVTAGRRMIDRHPTSAPLWWFASRVLTAPDPRVEARRAAAEIAEDDTPLELAHALPDGARVCVLGWPEVTAAALVRVQGAHERRAVAFHAARERGRPGDAGDPRALGSRNRPAALGLARAVRSAVVRTRSGLDDVPPRAGKILVIRQADVVAVPDGTESSQRDHEPPLPDTVQR